MELNTIVVSDALDLLRGLGDKSVNAIIADPPYNTTNLDFEQLINWVAFWQEARRVLIHKKSPVILFSQQPFTTDLICSNRKGYRYEIIWHKTMPVGFLDANRRPLRCHENILVFGDTMPDYFPQMKVSTELRRQANRTESTSHYGKHEGAGVYTDDGSRYPRSVWTYAQRDSAFVNTKTLHPTQKPLDLMTELILTYTRPNDIILDCFAGSGSTCIAARNTGRHFIACDSDAGYVAAANLRLINSDPYADSVLPDGRKQLSLFAQENNNGTE